MDYENAAYSPDTETKSILKLPRGDDTLNAFSDEEEGERDGTLEVEEGDSILEMDHLDVDSLNTKKNVSVAVWRRGRFR